MDQQTKKKIKEIVKQVAEGKLSYKMAVDQICQFMDSYADRAVVAYLELEKNNYGSEGGDNYGKSKSR